MSVHYERIGPDGALYRQVVRSDDIGPFVARYETVKATHINYNTGDPCFCDARFGYRPGPCLDEPEHITGSSPENGS